MSDAGIEPTDEVLEFARAFARLAVEAYRLLPLPSSVVAERVAAHLGADPAEATSVGQLVPVVERPNLQLALNQVVAEQPAATVLGLSPEIGNYGGFSFSALLSGRFQGPTEPISPVFDELPVDVDATLRCVTAGLWLVDHDGAPAIVGVAPAEHHGMPGTRPVRVEVFATEPDVAQGLLDRLAELRRVHNVYRGKVLSFSHSEYGEFGISFMRRPTTTAEEVILPPADRASIERHVIGIAQRAGALLAAGQHLKRGLLLYGPPGTGKTHTISYLMAAMPERTVVVLQGPSVGALGQAAAIVRSLTPAMLVVEDVDLIATERGMPGFEGSNPLMFQLLNEMDGLTTTDDVCFILTTNRADVLEPALVARPGRIDHAVEIGLPDQAARLQLLRLYLDRTAHAITDLGPVVDRTAGVTASFMKELVRRAAHLAIDEADPTAASAVAGVDGVSGAGAGARIELRHLDAALDELLVHAVPITRAMLGSGPTGEPSTGELRPDGPGTGGWSSSSP